MLTKVNMLKIAVPIDAPPPERIVEKWARGAKNNADYTNENRKIAIPDSVVFQKKLADPASKGWQDMVNPAFKSKKGRNAQRIKNAHRANIMRAFDNYETALDHVFEEVDGEGQKRYKERIDQSKDIYASGLSERTLRFTGSRINGGRGVVAIAARWLTGDGKVVDDLPPGTTFDGKPVNVAKPGLEPNLKSALVPRLTQSGIAIVHSEMDAAMMAEENTLINSLLSGLRDSTVYEEFVEPLTPLKSHCGYVVESGQLYLVIQVVTL